MKVEIEFLKINRNKDNKINKENQINIRKYHNLHQDKILIILI